MLYNLAQCGYDIPILEYGMNVIMDCVKLAAQMRSGGKGGGAAVGSLREAMVKLPKRG